MKLDNKNIFCSVSAGYSSVLMAIRMKEWYPNHNIIYAMANTSKERVESLNFMHECDKHFGLGIAWVEAEINNNLGVGTDFRVVSFNELKRNGEIFEQGIKKYGIPSQVNKWCNRDLKLNPLRKYADSIFGKGNYSIAVGLRIDEIDRVMSSYKTNNVFYPLIDYNINTIARNEFWSDQSIKLKIPAYKGNCDLCFEKSNRKLMTILLEDPTVGMWWSDMINKYGKIAKKNSDSYNSLMKKNGIMTFYRECKTVLDLIIMAKRPFRHATDEYMYENTLFDQEGDCGGGCVVF